MVVDLLQKLADGRAGVGQVAIFVAEHFFIIGKTQARATIKN